MHTWRGASTVLVGLICFAAVCRVCLSIMTVRALGTWPEDWPAELEPCRSRSFTLGVATGTSQDIYEIPFEDRVEFERLWPVILALKSKGAPLTLYSPGHVFEQSAMYLLSDRNPSHNLQASGPAARNAPAADTLKMGSKLPVVRIIAPPAIAVSGSGNRALRVGPPWPESIKSEKGELPEYVVREGNTWVPYRGQKPVGFIDRARVDLELVVDGRVIDLNRIRLPADTPIVDKRVLDQESPAPASLPASAPG